MFQYKKAFFSVLFSVAVLLLVTITLWLPHVPSSSLHKNATVLVGLNNLSQLENLQPIDLPKLEDTYQAVVERTRLLLEEKRKELSVLESTLQLTTLSSAEGHIDPPIESVLLSTEPHHDSVPAPVTFRPRKPTPRTHSRTMDLFSGWHSGSLPLTALDLPDVRVESVDCSSLFRGDKDEQAKAAAFQNEYPKDPIMPEKYISKTSNCTAFVAERRYAMRPANQEEAEFPLAFSILLFKDVEQFERLLRAVYRPQNIYCIHVDHKSSAAVHDAVDGIANCFSNVFVLEQSFNVYWGTFSVLQPELACMTELLRRDKKWKYFINLTGQEFPLKTNWEIVRILKAFNGSNNLEGTVKRRNPERFTSNPPAPINVTLTKGSVHIAAIRDFVDYVINNEDAKLFLEWVKNTYIPDETFFTSLNHSPQLKVPGSYLGEPETDNDVYPFITRFKNWGDGPFDWPCAGKRVSMVCIFAVGDLPLLVSRPELFANKFYLDFEPLTLDCMEEWHYRRLRNQLMSGSEAQFNTSAYSKYDFVRNHL